jgi:hypothetical protein
MRTGAYPLMSVIHPGDEELHYSDGSHRWLCTDPMPDDEAQSAWVNRVRAHLDQHRELVGRPSPRNPGSGRNPT